MDCRIDPASVGTRILDELEARDAADAEKAAEGGALVNVDQAGDGAGRTGSAVKVNESAMQDIESKDDNIQVGDKPIEFNTE